MRGVKACDDWRPNWRWRIVDIVLLVLFLICLALIILGALGDEWVRQQREEGRPVATYSILDLRRPIAVDGVVSVQDTSLGRCVIGLGMSAVWHYQGERVEVPTAWFRASAYPALDRCRWAAIEGELVSRAIGGGR